MLRTFNCGIGLVLCLPAASADAACAALEAAGERAWRLGHIAPAQPGTEPRVELTGDWAR
jgi:phosphoribosylformylglycinamidine cyclo-ligase